MAVPDAVPVGIPDDPVGAARSVGLRHVSDDRPGITRRKRGEGFVYVGPDGQELREETTLARIRKLAVPPAWTEVWICPFPNGHLQATGRDAKGRKQYRYHPRWHEVRDETKYSRMLAFAQALPIIRRRVHQDLGLSGLPKRKVLAAVVRLLETTFIRVGNEEYARENGSFGLTTLRDRHVAIEGSTLRFSFKGKAGKRHSVGLQDKRLAGVVRRCRDLPGYELFQYIDEEGNPQPIDSADVNDYLREIAGDDFTAKDFRTWAGTTLAALALEQCETATSPGKCRRHIAQAVERVAGRLGNTPAICRKSYVHPAVFDAYMEGITLGQLRAKSDGGPGPAKAAGAPAAKAVAAAADGTAASGASPGELEEQEKLVLAFLQFCLDREATERRKIA